MFKKLAKLIVRGGVSPLFKGVCASAVLEAIAAIPTSPVKSIQRGTLSNTFSSSSYNKDITINSVNAAKCMITLSGDTAVDMRYGSNTQRSVLTASVLNSTTLRFSASGVNSNYSATYYTRWELVEFY